MGWFFLFPEFAVNEIAQHSHKDIGNGHKIYDPVVDTTGGLLPLSTLQYCPAHGTLCFGRQYSKQEDKDEYAVFHVQGSKFNVQRFLSGAEGLRVIRGDHQVNDYSRNGYVQPDRKGDLRYLFVFVEPL